MMTGIRLRNRSRVYDLFQRLAAKAKTIRGVIRLLPYTGATTFREVVVDMVPFPGFGKPLPKGKDHQLNGSRVTLWYTACNKPTAEQIKQAQYATQVLHIPRKRYTGTLVDVFLHNGTLYCQMAGVLERDRGTGKHPMNFRHFNLDDGDLFAAYFEDPVLVPQAPKVTKRLVVKGRLKKAKRVKKAVRRV